MTPKVQTNPEQILSGLNNAGSQYGQTGEGSLRGKTIKWDGDVPNDILEHLSEYADEDGVKVDIKSLERLMNSPKDLKRGMTSQSQILKEFEAQNNKLRMENEALKAVNSSQSNVRDSSEESDLATILGYKEPKKKEEVVDYRKIVSEEVQNAVTPIMQQKHEEELMRQANLLASEFATSKEGAEFISDLSSYRNGTMSKAELVQHAQTNPVTKAYIAWVGDKKNNPKMKHSALEYYYLVNGSAIHAQNKMRSQKALELQRQQKQTTSTTQRQTTNPTKLMMGGMGHSWADGLTED